MIGMFVDVMISVLLLVMVVVLYMFAVTIFAASSAGALGINS